MVNIAYEAVSRYFNHLSNVGYFKQSDVNKLILVTFIQELLDQDFRGLVSEDDYDAINRALYCLYGSSCLIPYPDYYKNKTNGVMYTGSMSELVHRVEALEEGGGGGGEPIQDKQIIVPSSIEEEVNNDDNDAPEEEIQDPLVDG